MVWLAVMMPRLISAFVPSLGVRVQQLEQWNWRIDRTLHIPFWELFVFFRVSFSDNRAEGNQIKPRQLILASFNYCSRWIFCCVFTAMWNRFIKLILCVSLVLVDLKTENEGLMLSVLCLVFVRRAGITLLLICAVHRGLRPEIRSETASGLWDRWKNWTERKEFHYQKCEERGKRGIRLMKDYARDVLKNKFRGKICSREWEPSQPGNAGHVKKGS